LKNIFLLYYLACYRDELWSGDCQITIFASVRVTAEFNKSIERCDRYLPFPPFGKEFYCVIISWFLQEEKHAEAKIENPEKACGKDGGVKKKRTM